MIIISIYENGYYWTVYDNGAKYYYLTQEDDRTPKQKEWQRRITELTRGDYGEAVMSLKADYPNCTIVICDDGMIVIVQEVKK